MTNAKHRINELTKRQVYYGSSLVCKLNAVNGHWYYTVYAWIENVEKKQLTHVDHKGNKIDDDVDALVDEKILVLMNKYNGEDPNELFNLAEKELCVMGIKTGVPIPMVGAT